MQKTVKVEDIIGIIKRRRRGFILSALCVLFITGLLLFLWKPTYRATSTILIEEQEIPRDYVMATVTSYADERLQSINQRIMSGARLLEIINRFNLYADKRDKWTSEEIIENMRKNDIRFETKTAEVVDRRTGRPTEATIAFTVSYEGSNPLVVQKVANVLASLYLEENIKVVGQQTASTTRFLEEEMNSVQADLAVLEREMTAYKEKNPRALPELLQFNLQTLDWIERNRDQLVSQLRMLRERESYLQSELAAIAPEKASQDRERLRELRVLLDGLTARYTREYPDVVRITAEISELEKRTQSSGGQQTAAERPDNPGYVTLSSQLASVLSEIDSVKNQIEEVDRRGVDYRRRLEASPRVEEGYRRLLSERNNTQAKYDDLMNKFMEAKVAAGLEEGQMGERFTLVDPPRVPEKPVSPNRPVILFVGLLLALGAGVATASVQEALDKSARSTEDIVMNFPLPVLGEIPEIVTLEGEIGRRRRAKLAAGVGAASVVILVILTHFFVVDLDVLWAAFSRRLPW
ncbi:MAG: chain-length determining protein [Deltaproteobacteria bacterium GWA2_54_12]|nr:MAG: chain-length determining protein [Deltaproteobacteria bacterium GWA2_54_12]